ncbi:MAG: STAS domain-containing protein [Bacteroidia bacterium]
MEFRTTNSDQVVVYHLKGNLIGETDGIPLTESFSEFLDNNSRKFVISLQHLQHINSSGLGVLITLLTKARKHGGDVYLANPSSFIMNLLIITKLNTIFKIFPTEEEAILGFVI